MMGSMMAALFHGSACTMLSTATHQGCQGLAIMGTKKATRDGVEQAVEQRLWEQQRDEKPHEYAAFKLYLNQLSPRSADAVAEETGGPARTIRRWRTDNRWVERAQAWDSYRLQQSMAAAADAHPDEGNPYDLALRQQVSRAQRLHEAAESLLTSASERMTWTRNQYLKKVAQAQVKREDWEAIEPPLPETAVVQCIRGCSDVMAKSAEAQALALGIHDVLTMAQQGAKGGQ